MSKSDVTKESMSTILIRDEIDVAVILRCLAYGERAISEQEEINGIANAIRNTTGEIRRQLTHQLYTGVLAKFAKQ